MLIAWTSVAAACPSLGEALDAAEAALVEVRTDEVERALEDAERALGCDRVATRDDLGRMWMVEGVFATVARDRSRAEDAFSALARVDPGRWDDVYGPDVLAAYEAAARRPQGIAQIVLQPDLGENVAWLDGKETKALANGISGLHALQITDPFGALLFGTVVYLAPDQRLEIATGIAPSVVRTRKPLQKRGWLVAAAGGLASGGLFALAADRQNRAMLRAESVGGVDRAYGAQIAFAGLSYGSFAFAGTSATVFAVAQ